MCSCLLDASFLSPCLFHFFAKGREGPGGGLWDRQAEALDIRGDEAPECRDGGVHEPRNHAGELENSTKKWFRIAHNDLKRPSPPIHLASGKERGREVRRGKSYPKSLNHLDDRQG